jgi:hypothetical protein
VVSTQSTTRYVKAIFFFFFFFERLRGLACKGLVPTMSQKRQKGIAVKMYQRSCIGRGQKGKVQRLRNVQDTCSSESK